MKKMTKTEALTQAISLLEKKKANDLYELKEQFHQVKQSLMPMNVLKSALHTVSQSHEARGNILNNMIGIATGYLSKKIVVRGSHNPLKMALGALLQFTVAKAVAKHPEKIKEVGGNLLHKLFNKLTSRRHLAEQAVKSTN